MRASGRRHCTGREPSLALRALSAIFRCTGLFGMHGACAHVWVRFSSWRTRYAGGHFRWPAFRTCRPPQQLCRLGFSGSWPEVSRSIASVAQSPDQTIPRRPRWDHVGHLWCSGSRRWPLECLRSVKTMQVRMTPPIASSWPNADEESMMVRVVVGRPHMGCHPSHHCLVELGVTCGKAGAARAGPVVRHRIRMARRLVEAGCERSTPHHGRC